MPAHEKLSDIFGIARQRVVGGDGDDDRALVAQVRLGGEGHRRVGNAVCEFCQRIARARRNDEDIQQLLRSDRLCLRDGVDDRLTAGTFQPRTEILRCAETGVGLIADG